MSNINWVATTEYPTTLPSEIPSIIVLEQMDNLEAVAEYFKGRTDFTLNPFQHTSRVWVSTGSGKFSKLDYILTVDNDNSKVISIVDLQSKHYDPEENAHMILVWKV